MQSAMKMQYQLSLRALGFEPTKEELKKLVVDCDKDGDYIKPNIY
jgi:Ca2+-binding EF-hand superfamily protein